MRRMYLKFLHFIDSGILTYNIIAHIVKSVSQPVIPNKIKQHFTYNEKGKEQFL